MVNIQGLSKAKVLAALYNKARPQGLGLLQFTPQDMTEDEAKKIIEANGNNLYFDYLNGRVIKVDLSQDEFDPWGYDRDNGQGSAQKVIGSLA